MVCTGFTQQRNKGTGDALYIDATFVQVRIVSTDTVAIEERQDTAIGTGSNSGSSISSEETNLGKKTPVTIPETKQKTVLYNLFKKIPSLGGG